MGTTIRNPRAPVWEPDTNFPDALRHFSWTTQAGKIMHDLQVKEVPSVIRRQVQETT